MPEGDTVWLSAKRLHDALAGRLILTCELRLPRLALVDLRGQSVLRVLARGKHILLRLSSEQTLHSHLRMDGAWSITAAQHRDRRYGNRPASRPEHMIRARIGNEEWLAIGVRIHDLQLIATADEGELVGHLGPDLLGPDWDEAEAVRRLRAQPERTIAEALLDQRNLAGIGNLYKSEVLFLSGINPWRPVGAVADLVRLVSTAHRLLRGNRDHPEQTTTGSKRRGEQHWVYLRAGESCRVCRTSISWAKQGPPTRERDTYWCPRCQPSLVTADAQAPGSGAG